ncbi:MAG TPA: cupin domain-containing protein [Hyphomonadaceae bacterium]|nr:cupin domain-containing protein [Hyphomonadaceae bacterium]
MRRYLCVGLAATALGACSSYQPATVHDIVGMKPERISPGLMRRYISTDNSSLAIYDMRKGVKVSVHTHGSEQVSYVQAGRVRFVVCGEVRDLRRGQAIVIPQNAPHSIEALEDSIEIDYFVPARSDWIKDADEQQAAPPPSGQPGERRS